MKLILHTFKNLDAWIDQLPGITKSREQMLGHELRKYTIQCSKPRKPEQAEMREQQLRKLVKENTAIVGCEINIK